MKGRTNQAARCTCTGGAAWCLAAALGAAIAIGMTSAPALGQTAEMNYDNARVAIDSGAVRWDDADIQAAAPQPIFSHVLRDKDARWLRLEFGVVVLSGALHDGTNSFLRITSLEDGGVQILDAVSIQHWSHTSAYFNGDSVLVELYSHPNTGANRLTITSYMAGGAPAEPPETQCGLFDDRVPSSDAGAARLSIPAVDAFCSAFLIVGGAGTNPTCFLSAGHCLVQDGDICEFNVPLSDADGSVNFAHPNDQYPVDPASIQGQNAGLGNDWVFFGCFPNSNTGAFAGDVQNPFPLASGPGGSAEIWNWGYGVENNNNFPNEPERNQIQQFEGDSGFTTTSTTVRYDQLDTMGGSSGSPIWKDSIGGVIAIHTNGGCDVFGGENKATRIDRPAIQTALANPLGICAVGNEDCPGPGSCFYDNGTPGCTTTTCCQVICALDSFCCDSFWDGICAGAALANPNCADDACPGEGDCFASGGNGSPGCTNDACCNTVCAVDPFCCNGTWDFLCAAQALDICPDAPPTGACCLVDFTGCADNTLEGDCIAGGGIWQGPDTSCALVDCFPDCPAPGNCFVPHLNPGCNNNACCENVCIADDFCCEIEWDQFCADQAFDICGFDECPGPGGCFAPNGTPGCVDPICCNIVCTLDPFCCDIDWDGICVEEAFTYCEGAPCFLECPPGALDEGEPCLLDGDTDTTNGGCNNDPPVFTPASCGDVFCGRISTFIDGVTGLQTRDTDWYLVAHGGGPFSATLISQFPGLCFILDGIGTCDPVVVGTIGCAINCDPMADAFADLPPGEYAVFVSSGTCDGGGIFSGLPCGVGNDYVLEINCTPPQPCPGEGGCFVPNGTPGCDDAACCFEVCAVDSFCCSVGWDLLCAAEAIDICLGGGHPACPGEVSCVIDHGTPGCSDPNCCNVICLQDPFCCDTFWDGLCADEALDICYGGGSTACPGAGDCYAAHATVGCDDGDCCNAVCVVDPFCCNTAWDAGCAAAANVICTCPCDFDNDGDVDVDDLLLLLANWGGPGGDCNGDGTTNVNDLLGLLAQWGPCP